MTGGRLATTIRIGWAIGEFAIASHMAIISIYLLYYLTDVQHFPGALAGTLILIPRLFNVVTDPLMGGVSDRCRSRWGRRRPFLLAGALIWGAAYCAMFWIPHGWALWQKSASFLVTCLCVNIGLSLYHVPYSAMLPEMTRDAGERLQLSGYKEIAARLAVLLTVMASPLIVKAAPDPLTGYRWIGLLTGGFILFSGITAFVATAKAPSEAFQPQSMNWREQLRTFRANAPLFRLSGVYLLSSACDAFYSAMMIYFVTSTMRLDGGTMSIIYPVGSLTAMFMTTVWSIYGRRVGRRRACGLAFIGGALAFALSLALPAGRLDILVLYMLLVGSCFAGIFLLPSSIVPDTVEYDEKISGHRREGTIYGAWVFTQQTGMAIGAFLVGIYLDTVGYHPGGANGPDVAMAIRFGFALGPVLLLAAGALLLRRLTIGGLPAVTAQSNSMHQLSTPSYERTSDPVEQ